MNAYIIVGILIIAFGTGLMLYGQHIKSRSDSAVLQVKVEHVLKSIDETKKGEKDEDKTGKMQQIEQEFKTWATDFLKDREQRKLALAKHQLDSVGEQFKVSNELRPVFEYVLKTIESLARAYNAESGQKVLVDFPPIPSNLYSQAAEDYRGNVIFPSKVVWRVRFNFSKPPQRQYPPSMQVIFLLSEKDSFSDSALVIKPESTKNEIKEFIVIIIGSNVPTTEGIEGRYQVESYRESLKMIMRRLFESQLLRD
jgi:hypothetical protein